MCSCPSGMKFIPGGSVTRQRAVPREDHLSSLLAHLLLPQVRLALTNMLCSELGESQWLGFLGPGCTVSSSYCRFISTASLSWTRRFRTEQEVGRKKALRQLASSVAPCISEQHTPEIVIFSGPLLCVCFSSPSLKRGFTQTQVTILSIDDSQS